MIWLFCLLLGAGGNAQQDAVRKGPPNLGLAPGLLKRGQNQLAVKSFRKELNEHPDSVMAHVGLGKALARSGQCVGALDELQPYVGTLPFGVDTALAAAVCATRLGLHMEAIYYDQIAVELDPDSARAWTNLALDLHLVGDTVGMQEALDHLAYNMEDGRDASLFAQAAIAIRSGDIESFEFIRLLWTREGRPPRELNRLDATLWMDLDDPQSAIVSLDQLRRLRKGLDVRHLRAEATRRLGDAEGASVILEEKRNAVSEGSESDAIRVRILADLGQLDEARTILEQYEDSDDEDLLMSRWYIAWRTQDTATMSAVATRLGHGRTNPLRQPEQLIPVNAR